jgi:hypothetical protein
VIASQRTSGRVLENSKNDVFEKNRQRGFNVFRLFQPVTALGRDQYGSELLVAFLDLAFLMDNVVTD